MELQELGTLLNQAAGTNSRNIGELSLQNKNKPGVFSDIKKRSKWILLIFACATLIFVPYFISHRESEFISLFLFVILSIESIITIIALMQIRAIERSTGNITQNLFQRIRHVRFIFRSYIFLNTCLYIFLLVFLEYSMYYHLDPNFEGFYRIPLPLRLTLYCLFIALQYFMKRRSFQKNYGEYLNKMIGILAQTRG